MKSSLFLVLKWTSIIAVVLFARTLLAQAAPNGSAQSVQLNAEPPSVPLLYITYVTPTGQFPQTPYQIGIGNIFVAMQSVSEKSGKNGGVSYSFNLVDKFGGLLVTQYRIEWLKDGVLRDTRYLAAWKEVGANWYFSPTVIMGKNTEMLRTGFVNDILGSTAGGTLARYNGQMFTVDGPGNYEIRIWATVDGLPVFKQIFVQVSTWYEYVG